MHPRQEYETETGEDSHWEDFEYGAKDAYVEWLEERYIKFFNEAGTNDR